MWGFHGRNTGKRAPTERAIENCCIKYRIMGCWLMSDVCTAEAIAAVAESRRSQQVWISRTTLKRILHKDLGMVPYKVQLIQAWKPNNLS